MKNCGSLTGKLKNSQYFHLVTQDLFRQIQYWHQMVGTNIGAFECTSGENKNKEIIEADTGSNHSEARFVTASMQSYAINVCESYDRKRRANLKCSECGEAYHMRNSSLCQVSNNYLFGKFAEVSIKLSTHFHILMHDVSVYNRWMVDIFGFGPGMLWSSASEHSNKFFKNGYAFCTNVSIHAMHQLMRQAQYRFFHCNEVKNPRMDT